MRPSADARGSTIIGKKTCNEPITTAASGAGTEAGNITQTAAISKTGDEILIKSYTQIFYWKKSSGESMAHCLQQTPVRAAYQPEDKGEAICWATDGSGYFTTSEGEGEPVYFYKRK